MRSHGWIAPMRPARARRSSSDAPVDLRSDTVTRPTKRMREAMAAAEVDDDVLGHDPTMRELETRVAGLLGTDDALWTPTGSMGNLIALMSHLRRGDLFLAPAGAHVLDAELGTAAWLAGGMPRPLPHDAGPGKVSPGAVRRAAGSAGPYYTMRTTLLCLENTHNAAGARVPRRSGRGRRHAHARPAGAPRRRAHLQRRGRPRRPARRTDGRVDTISLLQQGARRPGRLVAAAPPSSCSGLGGSARCSAAACGRQASSRRRPVRAAANVERLAEDHVKARSWPRACASGAGPSGSRRPTSC